MFVKAEMATSCVRVPETDSCLGCQLQLPVNVDPGRWCPFWISAVLVGDPVEFLGPRFSLVQH